MLGTAGGMYHFRDHIRAGNPDAFFVLNGDVCSDFPLNDLYQFHKSKNGQAEVIRPIDFGWRATAITVIIDYFMRAGVVRLRS